MKNPKLGDHLLWKGKLAKVVYETDQRTVGIELLENCKCPHCDGDLGKEQINIIPISPLFQENAEVLQIMSGDKKPK
jgi:hypothetical protein